MVRPGGGPSNLADGKRGLHASGPGPLRSYLWSARSAVGCLAFVGPVGGSNNHACQRRVVVAVLRLAANIRVGPYIAPADDQARTDHSLLNASLSVHARLQVAALQVTLLL